MKSRSLAELDEEENADEKVLLLTTHSKSYAIKGRKEMWLYFKSSKGFAFLIVGRT